MAMNISSNHRRIVGRERADTVGSLSFEDAKDGTSPSRGESSIFSIVICRHIGVSTFSIPFHLAWVKSNLSNFWWLTHLISFQWLSILIRFLFVAISQRLVGSFPKDVHRWTLQFLTWFSTCQDSWPRHDPGPKIETYNAMATACLRCQGHGPPHGDAMGSWEEWKWWV